MIYSIALLDQSDFECIGWEMPNYTGVDCSVIDGTVVWQLIVQKRSVECKKRTDKENKPLKKAAIATALEVGSLRESKLVALHLFLEFGSSVENGIY
jgi:hypothetical protein